MPGTQRYHKTGHLFPSDPLWKEAKNVTHCQLTPQPQTVNWLHWRIDGIIFNTNIPRSTYNHLTFPAIRTNWRDCMRLCVRGRGTERENTGRCFVRCRCVEQNWSMVQFGSTLILRALPAFFMRAFISWYLLWIVLPPSADPYTICKERLA